MLEEVQNDKIAAYVSESGKRIVADQWKSSLK